MYIVDNRTMSFFTRFYSTLRLYDFILFFYWFYRFFFLFFSYNLNYLNFSIFSTTPQQMHISTHSRVCICVRIHSHAHTRNMCGVGNNGKSFVPFQFSIYAKWIVVSIESNVHVHKIHNIFDVRNSKFIDLSTTWVHCSCCWWWLCC